MNKKILLIEDEEDVASIVRDYLESSGFSVDLHLSGDRVVEQVRHDPPDLILLDIMLPGVDGKTICREIRAFSAVPIIMITAMADESDRLIGYDLGADDYICKPVNPREILARVKAVLRRWGTEPETRIGSLILDESKRQVLCNGETVSLTATEFSLLNVMSGTEGKIFSRKQIIEMMYEDATEASERSVDTCVKKLKRKFEQIEGGSMPIQSVYGAGYKYEET